MKPRILILSRDSKSARLVFHFLGKNFGDVQVIFEKPESRFLFLKRRIARLGLFKTFGQVLFMFLIYPFLKLTAQKRIHEIINTYTLNDSPIPNEVIQHVESVNSGEVISASQQLNPDIIVVHGTRIISKETIDSLGKPMLNIHAGCTPHYRGVHGMYWALVNNDPERCGVTVHRVDIGIDTGQVLQRKTIRPSVDDNFSSYPFLQLAEGLLLLEKVISETRSGIAPVVSGDGKGKLWYHPTIGEYIRNRRKGVK